MKRTPLRRKTPLVGGKPLRRSGIKAKARPKADRVDAALHRHVLERDGMCFGILAYIEQGSYHVSPWSTRDLPALERHVCADRFGNPHVPNALDRLTVDHFWLHAGGTKGSRAPSEPRHLVAMCAWLNNNPPSAALREHERAYSRWRYGESNEQG